MERAVTAVQEMDQAEYQAKVCEQPVCPMARRAMHVLWETSNANTYIPLFHLPLGANLAHLGKV